MTQIARNGTPFFEVVSYLKLFWKIFFENPVNHARIKFFESAIIGTFVRAESAIIETGFKMKIRTDNRRFEAAKNAIRSHHWEKSS